MAPLSDSVGSIGGRRAEIILNRDGGYDFLIAIHEDMKEDTKLLNKLQDLIQGASEAMLTATDGRMYFHNVTILVPSNWTEKPTWKPAQGESFARARFLIESGLDSYLEPIYTLQPGGCGEEGDFVHITPDYIKSFRELPYPFQDEDIYEKYDFDPYDSGDFSFVENLLSTHEYIPGLILNLVAQDQRQDLYPNDATNGDVFQHTLWSFLMKQIMGVRMSKEVGDRYEVWRIEKQKDSFDTVLSRRLIHLHNNKVGRELSLTFDIGNITKVIFKLAKDAALDCATDILKLVLCGIRNLGIPFSVEDLTEEILLGHSQYVTGDGKALGRCVKAFKKAPKDLLYCLLKKMAVGGVEEWVATSVREVQRSMTAQETISQMAEDFDSVNTKDFDRSYLPIKYGAKEKRLVREWAHLRWGLFDENPRAGEPSFYNAGKIFRPTGCPRNIKGRVHDSRDIEKGCRVDSNTGLPVNCAFELDGSKNNTASLMYAEFLPSVTKFCIGGYQLGPLSITLFRSDYHLHDAISPNQQNKICSEKSAWEVLSTLPDFASNHGKKSFRSTIFTIVQQKQVNNSKTVCLSLDTSGSMSGDRIQNLGRTVRDYLETYVQDGFTVGIVHFTSYASTRAPMTKINDRSDRSRLLSAVPTSAGGGTNIGAGLQLCQQMLTTHTNGSPSGSYILLLSDGESSIGSDVIPSLKRDGIIVNTIAYGQNTGTTLDIVANETGGRSYFAGENNALNQLTASLLTIARYSSDDAVVTVANQQVKLSTTNPTQSNSIFLDSSIQDTRFSFTYSQSVTVNVTMEDTSADIVILEEPTQNRITADINGTVTGEVTYSITSVNPGYSQNIAVTVTSTPSSDEDPINIDAKSDTQTVSFTENSQVIFYVTVMKGVIPVSGLSVVVTVILPSNDEVKIILLDNGAAVDSTKGDGVYSGVLNANQFDGDSYYSWKVDVNGIPHIKNVSKCGYCDNGVQGFNLSAITRNLEGGSLHVSNWYHVTEDNVSPETVRDLRLLTAVDGSDIFTIGWTAVGDNPGQGMASGYAVAAYTNQTYVYNISNLEPNYWVWTKATDLEKEAGQPVQIKINITELASLETSRTKRSINDSNTTTLGPTTPPPANNDDETVYYIRIQALDAENNTADWSNIVSASFLKPEVFKSPLRIDGDSYEVYSPNSPSPAEVLLKELMKKDEADKEAPADHKELINLVAVIGGSIGGVVILFIAIIVVFAVIKKKRSQ